MFDRPAAQQQQHPPARPAGRWPRTATAATLCGRCCGVLLGAVLLLLIALLMLPGTGSAADPPTLPPVVPSLPNANHIPAPGLIPHALVQPPRWVPIAEDGVHDPHGPAVGVLQEPGEALAGLPPDSTGNQVRWVQALEQGAITPRASILPGTPVRLRDQDLIVARNGSMPAVKFPHRQHTLWLDCSNCHPYPFKDKLGANRLSMVAILNGEQCGLCHGAVSFPLTECNRCHSVPNTTLRAIEAAAAASRAAAATVAPAPPSAPAVGGPP
jgi:c(7)-type cytochrome triheme protein